MLILLTNDDGVQSPGLRAMARALGRLGRVAVAAPTDVRSAVSHSITLHRPLVVSKYTRERRTYFAIDGTPADCVKLAVHKLLPRRPDIVVSGINLGLNTGHNILYSGTVAGAMEASMHGITSFAVSHELSSRSNFERAATNAAGLIRRLAVRFPRSRTVFNINIPAVNGSRFRGVVVCAPELTPYRDRFESGRDPRGRSYFWLKPERTRDFAKRVLNGRVSDAVAIARGYITVSPLVRDLTHHDSIERLTKVFRP